MRLLLVEDSNRLRDTVALALRKSGYAVDATGDGVDGAFMALEHDYDIVILDIMLPGKSGHVILEEIRAAGKKTPVLFLTAKDTIEDRVAGLRKGADDYLVKPFALEELLARVEALCRRNYNEVETVVKVADVELDSAAKTVIRAGVKLDLTPREYALLEHLVLKAGTVISRTQLEEHIYDEMASPMSNVVDSAIYALRKKLAVREGLPTLIQTRRGLGYVFTSER